MAYFSNGTEGSMWEEEHCYKCVHNYDKDGEVVNCPILSIHMEYNYGQFGKDKKSRAIKDILTELIPRREDGFAGDCSMFVERGALGPTYLDKLRFSDKPVIELQREEMPNA